MTKVNGWLLPQDDDYFFKFLEGKPPKMNGFQREHLTKALEFVKKWDFAVDVGAHVGFWAKDMAEKFGRVYCFEPSNKTFTCLKKNLEEFDNVVLANVAVGDKKGRCSIARDSIRPTNSGSEFITRNAAGPIEMVSLDDQDLPGCDFLKIDVEGFELGVLRGAKATIKKFRPVISMECDKDFANRFGWHALDAQAFLSKRGYIQVAHMRPDKVFVPPPE